MNTCFCLLAACFAATPPPTEESAHVNPEAQKLADYVLAGLEDARVRLQSGMFHATGHLDLTHRQVDPLEGPIELLSAFDFRSNMFRFDRLEPTWLVSSPRELHKEGARKMSIVQHGGKYVKRADRTIQWMGAEPWVWIRRPNRSAHGAIRPFDIRVIGLLNWGSFDRWGTWERMLQILHRPVHDAVQENESLYRLVWVNEKTGVRVDRLFDATVGFSPVRTEQRQRPPNATGPWPDPSEVQGATWIRKNAVWVPTSWYQEILNPRDRRRRELTFEWQAVNEPLHMAGLRSARRDGNHGRQARQARHGCKGGPGSRRRPQPSGRCVRPAALVARWSQRGRDCTSRCVVGSAQAIWSTVCVSDDEAGPSVSR